MRRRQRQTGFPGLPTSFIDILFILIIVFQGIAILALLIVNPIMKKEDINSKAEVLIFMDWPKGDVDVDMWLRTPSGNVIYYQNKEQGLVVLERDDTGIQNDSIILDDGTILVNPVNHETLTFRGIEPGEYTLNIHLYRHGDYAAHNKILPVPIEVKIQMQKLNPKVHIFYQAKKVLKKTKQELHVVKFTIDAGGDIISLRDDLPESLSTLTGVKGYFSTGTDLPINLPTDSSDTGSTEPNTDPENTDIDDEFPGPG